MADPSDMKYLAELLSALFNELVAAGFTDDQALQIVVAYVQGRGR